MIVSITGSRSITDYKLVCAAVNESRFQITKIVSGGAAGVDTLAEVYAKNNGIEFEEYSAKWKIYGRRAGPIRNAEMAAVAEAAIIIWNGISKGSADYIKKIETMNKPLYLKKVSQKKYSNSSS